MKALRLQALTYAARMSPCIKGGATLGPNSVYRPENDDLPLEPTTPTIPLDPRFNDSMWDHSIIEDTADSGSCFDTTMDLEAVRSVAHNMYMGEMERLRREMVKQEMRKRLAAQQKMRDEIRERLNKEADKDMEEKSQILSQAFDERVQEVLDRLALKKAQYAAEDEKRLQEVAKRRELKQDVVKRQAEKAQMNANLDQIQSAQIEIRKSRQCYEEMLVGLSSDLRNSLKASFDGKFIAAIPECKGITTAEVNKWIMAKQNVDDLVRAVDAQIQKAKTEATAAAVAAEAAATAAIERNNKQKQLLQQQQQLQEQQLAKDQLDSVRQDNNIPEPSLERFISPEAETVYSQVESFGRQFEDMVRPLSSDPNMKQFHRNAKTAVNSLVTTISPTTVNKNFQDLCNLLSGGAVRVNSKLTFNSLEHPLGTKYVTFLLVNSIMDSMSVTIVEMATVIVWLAHRFPDVAPVFRYYLYKRFPTTVPYFPPQFEGQSVEEYKVVLGYKQGDTWVQHLTRVSWVTRLYANMTITQPRRGETNPFPLETGWKWLADVLNMDPVKGMSLLVRNYLEVAGQQMHRVYGRQFKRMVLALHGPYLRKLKEVDQEDKAATEEYELLLGKMARW